MMRSDLLALGACVATTISGIVLVREPPPPATANEPPVGRVVVGRRDPDRVLHEGVWYPAEEMDLVLAVQRKRAELAHFSGLSVREKRVFMLRKNFEEMWGRRKDWREPGPPSAETSSSFRRTLTSTLPIFCGS